MQMGRQYAHLQRLANMSLFESWIKKLKEIWESRSPQTVGELCADTFEWYEMPGDEPLVSLDALVDEWNVILTQKNISFTYQIISFLDGIGVAQWQASYTDQKSGKQAELDGIFKIVLDETGKCTVFRQWFVKIER